MRAPSRLRSERQVGDARHGGISRRGAHHGFMPDDMDLIAGIKRLLASPADEPGTLWRASWRGVVVAESDRTVVVEGNRYFPPDSLRREHMEPSRSHTICMWKGLASYYHVAVEGEVNPDAAWYYPSPSHACCRPARAVRGDDRDRVVDHLP